MSADSMRNDVKARIMAYAEKLYPDMADKSSLEYLVGDMDVDLLEQTEEKLKEMQAKRLQAYASRLSGINANSGGDAMVREPQAEYNCLLTSGSSDSFKRNARMNIMMR